MADLVLAPDKKPWQSKTLVVNAVLGLVAAVALFVPGALVVKDFIVGHALEIGMGWSILNLALRAITKDAISLVD